MNQITSASIIGIDAVPITIEADASFGMPSFQIVGLPDTSIKESRDRIRSAIKNSGLKFPRARVTINLAPAHIKKQGPMFDLPIALSILLHEGLFSHSRIDKTVILGELALDGSVRPVSGVLAAALMAKNLGLKVVIVPEQNQEEVKSIKDIVVIPVKNLFQLLEHFQENKIINPSRKRQRKKIKDNHSINFCDIKGQEQAKRALEIAAAGGHNVLLKGPPGTGKTMLARAFPSILPVLSENEALEVTSIASISGILKNGEGIIQQRPFRSPHHSCSAVSLVGGGAWPKPGEVTLAHRGILFLDELPEFSRHVLEHLRQPLEDGFVNVSRAAASVQFPARFLLLATMNPCPCGFLSDPTKNCSCSHGIIQKYRKKISGPLMDRFDLVIEVPNLEVSKLMDNKKAESSEVIQSRVCKARSRQKILNSEISPSKIDEVCKMDDEAKEVLRNAILSQQLSARGFSRIKKAAKTIADLEGKNIIEAQHIAEALQFRPQNIFDF